MKPIYLIPGLGADKRVFAHLDLSGYDIHHVEWITPYPNETLAQYAKRLLSQIATETPTLIGVSFGGIIAIEMAKQIPTEKIIIISSTKTWRGIPFHFRLMGKLGLVKRMPASFQKKVNGVTFWLFGTQSKKEEDILRAVINKMDSTFLLWAMDWMVNWTNETLLPNVVSIHGSDDRIFPITKTDYTITKGGHLMLINRSKEISTIIKSIVGI